MEQKRRLSSDAHDPELQEQIRQYQAYKRKKKKQRIKRLRRTVKILLAAVFCLSTLMVVNKLVSAKRDQKGFDELSAIVRQSAAAAREPVSTAAPDSVSQPPEEQPLTEKGEASAAPGNTPAPTPLPQYAELHERNDEFFGWLTVEAVGIDYPVMYSPERPEYYLKRDFYGKDSGSGTPFIDGRCPENGNYYLIYGHLMENKSVFGRLPRFEDEKLWRENPRFRFDTVYEEREYEIVAAFYSRLYEVEAKDAFRYYNYYDLSDALVFDEYIKQVKEAALYDTGVDVVYGDELLVLSTCARNDPDGRFAVVAKRIK